MSGLLRWNPTDGGLADPKDAREVPDAFALGPLFRHKGLLGGRQFRPAAELDAARLRAGAPLTRARTDEVTFKLGEAGQHRQHEPPVRGRGVRPCVSHGSELRILFGEGGDHIEQVPRRPGQAIEASDHQHIAGVERGNRPLQLCTVRLCTRGRLAEHFLAAGGSQLGHLRRDALTVGRNPCVAANHGPDSETIIRDRQAAEIVRAGGRLIFREL